MSFLTDLLNNPDKLSSFIGAATALSVPLFFNAMKELYFDLKKRKTERNYIAVQLIYLLDNLVSSCGEVSWDKGFDPYYPEPDKDDYEAQAQVPEFDLSLVKGDQKYLEPIMLYRLQGINIQLARAKERLREIRNSPGFSPGDIDVYFTERRREYAAIGLNVADMVKELRIKFKVPQRDNWNPSDTILDSLNQMNRERAVHHLQRMERKARRIMIANSEKTQI
ncbi:hypothetical protein SNN58_001684 [Cronobacter dublinensis]|nr:hypothetical protein [Cronobacter dublinensis]ELY3971106.1 hypothetical protein [Cronobacter dublinensis]ELY4485747.1 hypothetical protein [Cronobacter dublinensis]ELY5823198.1 hypothetical protein [Cronobacter dublinensis]